MGATNSMYDRESDSIRVTADHKTRLAAATLVLAYDEGLPIKRTHSVTGNFESADQILERFRQSPEAMRVLSGSGMKLQIADRIVDGDEIFSKKGG